MIKRLILGIVIGLAFGLPIGAGIEFGLSVWNLGENAILAYLAAAGTGGLVGLVAGKPIWAQGGKLEAGLKALFGALLAAGGMYALRKWAMVDINLISIHLGNGPVPLGYSPVASLLMISTALSLLFEIDNTDAPEVKGEVPKSPKQGLKGKNASSGPSVDKKNAHLPGDEMDYDPDSHDDDSNSNKASRH